MEFPSNKQVYKIALVIVVIIIILKLLTFAIPDITTSTTLLQTP